MRNLSRGVCDFVIQIVAFKIYNLLEIQGELNLRNIGCLEQNSLAIRSSFTFPYVRCKLYRLFTNIVGNNLKMI